MNRIAIVGASSELAADLIDVLVERGFDLAGLRVLADESLAGEAIEAAGYDVRVEPATAGSLAGCEAALFFGDGTLASALVPEAQATGALVIDASPFSREEAGAPLVVPEVNAASVKQLPRGTVIAVPGPHVVGLAVALAPLHEAATVRRVVCTTFESAAMRGRDALEELSRQSVSLMQGRGLDRDEFVEQLAFNLRPQAPSLDGEGWSTDERRIAREMALLFGEPRIDVAPTVVRTPVFAGTAQSVYAELERPLTHDEATRILRESAGILLPDLPPDLDVARDETDDEDYPEGDDAVPELLYDATPGPVDVSGSQAVHVARLRCDPRNPRGLAFWIAFDDLRKGSSLTVVATLEIALRDLH